MSSAAKVFPKASASRHRPGRERQPTYTGDLRSVALACRYGIWRAIAVSSATWQCGARRSGEAKNPWNHAAVTSAEKSIIMSYLVNMQ